MEKNCTTVAVKFYEGEVAKYRITYLKKSQVEGVLYIHMLCMYIYMCVCVCMCTCMCVWLLSANHCGAPIPRGPQHFTKRHQPNLKWPEKQVNSNYSHYLLPFLGFQKKGTKCPIFAESSGAWWRFKVEKALWWHELFEAPNSKKYQEKMALPLRSFLAYINKVWVEKPFRISWG